ncbi:hypothetical protein [Exiguobacterium antarcticum]|uniref:hypothetical protein n=1 Tax=Exiguobacterium antarcticum TaxID=132920 RepID=UPI000285EB55|nr:hypothetical protein [Exiguobacterium antarcticum]AFS70313.1 Hypothetical protein Eab7_1177 [Exiguobacterium antarcticum B7]
MDTSNTLKIHLDRVTASQVTGKHVATGLTISGQIMMIEQIYDTKRHRDVLHVHRLFDQWRTTTIVAQAETEFSYVDAFSDGRILLVASRCDDDVDGSWLPNAFIYDPSGHLLDRFCLDDGIQNVHVDEKDQIWVSYFDEGVFADAATNSIGSFGLAVFDEHGQAVFKNKDYPIDDCYALNVCSSNDAWFFYHPDYRIVHLENGKGTSYAAPLRQFSDFIVHGEHLISTDNDNTYLLKRDGNRYDEQARIQFESEKGTPLQGTIKMRQDRIVLSTETRLYAGTFSDFIVE